MESVIHPSVGEADRLLNHMEERNYGSRISQQQQQQQTPNDPNAASSNDDPSQQQQDEFGSENPADRDSMIERLTRRLRCLFSAITWPIVPLGTLVSLCLVWVLYSAFIVDMNLSCSHPLHAFAMASLCFLLYAPYHAQVRSFLFRYTRERDGPIRPTRVRLYDQLFHTICILYVYGGVTLMQSCKQDMGDGNPNSGTENIYADKGTTSFSNACDATCPHLYAALDVYVTMLELFTLSLILPLLFLPCIYLWILRRASTEAEHFWHESLDESDDLFGRTPRVSAGELMDSLEPVKLVRRGEEWALESRSGESLSNAAKDCCICMSDFTIQSNATETDEEAPPVSPEQTEAIVRTKCGHVFHTACLGSWVGGRWDPTDAANNGRRRAQRTCCPLCREDLQPTSSSM